MAQDTHAKPHSLSIQTDLLAYTSKGGYSLWGVYRRGNNQAYLAWVHYPNTNKNAESADDFTETRSWFRLGFTRYLAPQQLKGLYAGVNLEYYWRSIEEKATSALIQDNYFAFAPIVGYTFSPIPEGKLSPFTVMLWAGARFRPNYYRYDHVFTDTGAVFPLPSPVELTLGINLGWRFNFSPLVAKP